MQEDPDPAISTDTGAALIMRLSGELDAATTAPTGAALLRAAALPAPDLVVVDLTEVVFFPAAAVHALEKFAAACAERGIMTRLVVDTGSIVDRVVQLADLDLRIPVFASVEQAVGAGS
jgi:anti-anti-sigma factor